jgi:hypothetical protein
MPFYMQLLASLALISITVCSWTNLLLRWHPRKKPAKSIYLLAKETLENGVAVYTLERYKNSYFFFSRGEMVVLKRTFDATEAEKWSEMFSVVIEDFDE